MDIQTLQEKQKRAINSFRERISDAVNKTNATRIGELNCLHIAAYMDIEQTTKSLNDILEYKQEVAKQMLQCSDDKQLEQLAEVIKYADDTIKQVLGMIQ